MSRVPGLTTVRPWYTLADRGLMLGRSEGGGVERGGERLRTFSLVALSAATALAFAARAYRLEAQSIWLDEGLSVLFARPELGNLLPKLVTDDIHPPLYVLLLHFWLQVAGDGEFGVRFLSLLFGVLLVPLVYRMAVDLFAGSDEKGAQARLSGLVAALLVALSPFLVYYSQEARNYIVVAFWTSLSTWLLWRALVAGGGRWWWLYSVASALSLYTHYYAGFVLLAQSLYVLLSWSRWRPLLRSFALAMLGTAVLYAPWLIGLWGQVSNLWLHPDYWPGTLDLWTITTRTFAAFVAGSGQTAAAGPLALGFAALFGAGFLVLLWRGGLRGGGGELYVIVCAVVPLLAVYAITSRYPKFAERYLIIISPAFYLVLARGLAALYELGQSLAGRWAAAGGATVALTGLVALGAGALSASATWGVYYGPEWAKDDHRGAIAVIQAQGRPGDLIVLTRNTYQSFLYYYHGDLPWYGFDAASPGGTPDEREVAERLAPLVRGHTRVWHLLWQEEVTDATQTVAGLLRKSGRQVPLGLQFTGVRLNLYEMPPDVVIGAEPDRPLAVNYENGLRLLGYDLKSAQVRPGEMADLSFYWEATRQLGEDIGLSLALRDQQGLYWGTDGQRISGHYLPPSRWPLKRLVRSGCPLTVPWGTPPGRYTLELNVHLTPSLRELARVEPSGQPVGTRLDVGQLTVTPAGQSTAPTLAQMAIPLARDELLHDGRGAESMRLLGQGALPEEVPQGGGFDFSLYWERGVASGADLQVMVELSAVQTRQVLLQALISTYPTSQWTAGERLRGQYRLLVPADLPSGEYEVRLSIAAGGPGQVVGWANGGNRISLGRLRVTDLAREMAPPSTRFRADARFGDVASLYGFDLTGVDAGDLRVKQGQKIALTLHWESLAPTDTSYTVFVHLADAAGRPWGQQDAPPALGARPTTGWLAGEFVADPRQIVVAEDVPTGRYRLLVGLYGPDGKRLGVTTAAGVSVGSSLPLPGVAVEVQR